MVESKSLWDKVVDDMREREQLGIQRYAVPLAPFNNRDALRDAYEEALDLVVYLKQAIEEREQLMRAHKAEKHQRLLESQIRQEWVKVPPEHEHPQLTSEPD